MLFLDEMSIEQNYTMKDAILDLKEGFKSKEKGLIKNAHRLVLDFPKHHASCLYMPSANLHKEIGAIKIVSIFPNNPKVGLKTTQGVLLLTDISNGEHLCLMNATYLTKLRTGALSAIATKLLSNENSKNLGIIGTGAMAFEQALGVLAVRNIEKIFLYNRTKEKANLFQKRLVEFGINKEILICKNSDEVVLNSHILCCATRTNEPVFDGKLLQKGTHINGVGSYTPFMRELDETSIQKSSIIVVDDLKGAKEEAGELIYAEKLGIWSFDKVFSELSTLSVSNEIPRKNSDEITFFKCVGAAYFDLIVACGIYSKLKNQNIAQSMQI